MPVSTAQLVAASLAAVGALMLVVAVWVAFEGEPLRMVGIPLALVDFGITYVLFSRKFEREGTFQ